jgi:phosphoenolpyruvate phosphomutase
MRLKGRTKNLATPAINKSNTKSALLRRLIGSPELSFLMEAHNGLSARIAEEAGFEAIWASGLSISAAMGVRDSNEATWTQVLEVLEFMSDATSIPILIDGDTGYGDFNTMRRLVRKLESRQIAGVCIEDKLFPKTNSFIRGTSQPLAKIDEFCGKISAGCDARLDDDFVIVARVEAFIAGWGLAEALKRAEAYMRAGADAILMHSAKRNPSEVFEFIEAWENRLPVFLVPTKYFTTPTSEFRSRNVSAVIWANHNLRASIDAMQKTSQRIFEDQNLMGVEEKVAAISEVFRLQGADELAEAEQRYLPKSAAGTKVVVLAFTRGEEMGQLTENRPKAMVEVGGQPLLAHITEGFRSVGIRDLNVVRGYCADAIGPEKVPATYFDSCTHERKAEVLALSATLPIMQGDVIVCYGDVLFKKFIIAQLLESENDFAVMVDTDWRHSRNRDRYADYVVCSQPASRAGFHQPAVLKRVFHQHSESEEIHGEWMGFLRMSSVGSQIVHDLLEELISSDSIDMLTFDMADLLNLLIDRGHSINVIYTIGNWLDCDSISDALDGGSFTG